MRIALISYELPPDTGFGGIGTYTHQMAACLIKLGCDVEVFSASLTNAAFNVKTKEGYLVHRIKTSRAENFRDSIAALVAERHHYQPFDIAESPEYRAEGLRLKEMLPHLPMVVKFHTPHFLIRELNQQQKKRLLKYKIKKALGIGIYDKQKDKEYQFSLKCDGMISPSVSLGQIVHERWQIAKEKIAVIPYPFIPSEEFLKISADTQTNYITYLGRLEARKGVHLLAEALPLVFARLPQVRFRFIGRTNVG